MKTYTAKNHINGSERTFKSLEAAKRFIERAKYRGASFDRVEFSDEQPVAVGLEITAIGRFDSDSFKSYERICGSIEIEEA